MEDNRQKILLVDDSKQNIEILMDLFGGDYRVAAALNGEKALQLATADPKPDLIILDILMPDVDGYEVCKRLKKNKSTRNIPVIFVTAVSEVMDSTRGFEVGAVDYIAKPFHPPMVKARVALHLDLKRKRDLLEKYAFIDALTEIPNRRRFDEVLEKECNRSLRSHQDLSLILADVDHFKDYNDRYGHAKGDEVLRLVAKTLEDCLRRAGDFVGRYGGEEFGAVLPYTDADEARFVAENILAGIDGLNIPHDASSVAGHLTLSLGVATVDPDTDIDPKALLAAADKALYQAKAKGKRRLEAVRI